MIRDSPLYFPFRAIERVRSLERIWNAAYLNPSIILICKVRIAKYSGRKITASFVDRYK
jgi:hypothetical protein